MNTTNESEQPNGGGGGLPSIPLSMIYELAFDNRLHPASLIQVLSQSVDMQIDYKTSRLYIENLDHSMDDEDDIEELLNQEFIQNLAHIYEDGGQMWCQQCFAIQDADYSCAEGHFVDDVWIPSAICNICRGNLIPVSVYYDMLVSELYQLGAEDDGINVAGA